jgi:hypothetical protein
MALRASTDDIGERSLSASVDVTGNNRLTAGADDTSRTTVGQGSDEATGGAVRAIPTEQPVPFDSEKSRVTHGSAV